MSAAEVALIEPLWPEAKRGGRPRTTALREVVTAILSRLRTGCPWAMRPRELPPRSTVSGDVRRFGPAGVWHQIWAVLTMAARERAGCEASPTAGIIDRQAVKTSAAGGPRGFDAGKTIHGRKRPLVTDPEGLPLALVVHPANVQERTGLALVATGIRPRFPWRCHLFAAGGEQGPTAPGAAADRRLRLAIVKRPPDARGFEVRPRRRVIERRFAWLSRNRRLARDCERRIEASTTMVVIAIIQRLLRRLATS